MASCTSCGSPIAEGQAFCGACGRPVGAGAVAPAAPPAPPLPPAAMAAPAVPPQPQYQAPPVPYGQPVYGPGPGYPPGPWQQPRKSNKGLWIGIAASVLVLAVAAVLVFVVFWGQISGGGGPEQVAQKLLSAMEDKDIDAFFDVLSPGAIEELTGGFIGADLAKEMFKEELFTYESMKFEDVKMVSEISGDEATVSVTGGTVTITEDGETTTEDVRYSDTPVEFYLIRQDGKWYLDPSTFN